MFPPKSGRPSQRCGLVGPSSPLAPVTATRPSQAVIEVETALTPCLGCVTFALYFSVCSLHRSARPATMRSVRLARALASDDPIKQPMEMIDSSCAALIDICLTPLERWISAGPEEHGERDGRQHCRPGNSVLAGESLSHRLRTRPHVPCLSRQAMHVLSCRQGLWMGPLQHPAPIYHRGKEVARALPPRDRGRPGGCSSRCRGQRPKP